METRENMTLERITKRNIDYAIQIQEELFPGESGRTNFEEPLDEKSGYEYYLLYEGTLFYFLSFLLLFFTFFYTFGFLLLYTILFLLSISLPPGTFYILS